MSPLLALAIYFVIWWIVLFAVLPLGVRTQGEAGEIVPGTPESAPFQPRMLRVVLMTSVVSLAVLAVVWLAVKWRIVDFDALRDAARTKPE